MKKQLVKFVFYIKKVLILLTFLFVYCEKLQAYFLTQINLYSKIEL